MPYFGHARARSRLRLWAILVPVPETPVHEDGPTPHPIREVGRPGQISIPQTVSNTKSCHQFSHLKLRTRIGLLDRLHHARAGGRRNDVPWLYQSNILGHVDGQRSPRSLSRQVQPTASRDDGQKTCGAYKSLTIQIAVVVAAGRLSQVEAGHAGARNPHATRIDRGGPPTDPESSIPRSFSTKKIAPFFLYGYRPFDRTAGGSGNRKSTRLNSS